MKRGDLYLHRTMTIRNDAGEYVPMQVRITRTTFHGVYYRPVLGGAPMYCTLEEVEQQRYIVKMQKQT